MGRVSAIGVVGCEIRKRQLPSDGRRAYSRSARRLPSLPAADVSLDPRSRDAAPRNGIIYRSVPGDNSYTLLPKGAAAMPTTIVSIMALAFIVGPGYLARWVRSGTGPRPAESGTQELTRVTVFGFFSTISALFLLYVVRGHLFPAQWIADPEPLLRDSTYLSRNVGLVARTGAYVLLIACLLAVSATRLVLRGIDRREAVCVRRTMRSRQPGG